MKKIRSVLKNKYFLSLALIVSVSFLINIPNIIYQTSFGYDMARDAYEAHSIFPGLKAKILGPTTDIPGVNHGVLWFYALVVPYFLGNQDPHIVGLFFYIFAFLTVPLVWILTQKLFSDRKISFVATVIYAFSPFFVAYASWISNPILALYIAPVLLYFLWQYLQKPSVKSAVLSGIFLGLLIQSNLSFLLFASLIPVYLLVFRLKPKLKETLGFILSLFTVLISYLLAELRFEWKGLYAVMKFLQEDHSGTTNKFTEIVYKLIEMFELSVFPFPAYVVVPLLIVALVIFFRNIRIGKKPIVFLLIWLSNIALFKLFSTGVSQSSFLFIPSFAAGIILTAYVIVKSFKKWHFLITVLFVLIPIYFYQNYEWRKIEHSPATIQRSNSVHRYKQAVDFTYQGSGGEPFIITTVTNPLFVNTTWSYLYEFYGKRKYGYLPYYNGRSQEGFLGNLEEKQFGTKYRYLIIESTIGIPDVYVTKTIYEEDRVSDILEEKRFGYVRVQKRVFHENKPPIAIPADLKESPILYE